MSVPLEVQTNVPFMYQAYNAVAFPAHSRDLYEPPIEDEEVPDSPQEDQEFVGFEGEEALDIPPTSLLHMLTHEPKSRQCQVCLRSKLKRTPARRVHAPHRGTNFGDRWSIDHIGLGSTHPKGIGGATAVLTVYDDATALDLHILVKIRPLSQSCVDYVCSRGSKCRSANAFVAMVLPN